jgi:hypothetical protein
MKLQQSMIFFSFILIASLPGLGQDHPLQQSGSFQPSIGASNEEVFAQELMRMQMELNQIAQDMDSVDAKMILGIANKDFVGNSKTISEAHELLVSFVASNTVKAFTNPASSDVQWESCVKTSKLYFGLLEKEFELIKSEKPHDEKTHTPSSIADDSAELAQLVFLARMMTELQLRCSELQSHLIPPSDAKQQALWRGLREAIQNDDSSYLDKLKALLNISGESLPQFASRVILNSLKTSRTAATTVVEGMVIVSSRDEIWRLSDIPGVNPDFIRSLDCDKKAMKDFFASGSDTAFVTVRNCRKSVEGSSIQAFVMNHRDLGNAENVIGRTQPNFRELSQHPDIFHLPTGELIGDPLNPKKGDPKVGSDTPSAEDKGAPFGATFTAAPQPKIPSWWIRCMCPDDHSDAGMVVSGVRWHAPVLQCPNPELKRWEVK